MSYHVDPMVVPTTEDAITSYESQRGGHITRDCTVGIDLLAGSSELMAQRTRLMDHDIPSPAEIFGNVVNGDSRSFLQAIHLMTDTTFTLSLQL